MHAGPVLVIGGSRGTGLLIARLLSEQGGAVRVMTRDPASVAPRFTTPVHIVPGDLTNRSTLPAALEGVAHVIFTAGCRSGRPAGEAKIRATEYQGVVDTLTVARTTGFRGRFLYMTASGSTVPSFASWALNVYKGNTLVWRRRAEAAIRASGVDYTIIRAGVLVNRPGGQHAVLLTQESLPLSPRHRIARADVAEGFVAALRHPRTSRATFDLVWGSGARASWNELFAPLLPDSPS